MSPSDQILAQTLHTPAGDVNTIEDVAYSRSMLGSRTVKDSGRHKILGTLWDFHNDNLVFDLTDTASLARSTEPTKRNVINTATKFYDPLGVTSPIKIQFKILFQEPCKDKKDSDDPLKGCCKSTWQKLVTQLQVIRDQ